MIDSIGQRLEDLCVVIKDTECNYTREKELELYRETKEEELHGNPTKKDENKSNMKGGFKAGGNTKASTQSITKTHK